MVDEQKIAEKMIEIWKGIEVIASRIGCSGLKLQDAEAMFRFASAILQDREKIFDGAKFSIRKNGELSIEATFLGVHLHTVFFPASSSLESVYQSFTDQKVILKAAIALLVWALRESAQAIEDWHAKRF
jgi:malate/lactate dehydrogenase